MFTDQMTSPFLSDRKLQSVIEKLLSHPLYDQVCTVPALRIFMREHAFAVWDFMTLLKRLQQDFCGTRRPWIPPQHPPLARFVNEIVLAEESDTDSQGGFVSHFELYLRAMEEIQAETSPIICLLREIQRGAEAESVLDQLPIRVETREFVKFNLNIARYGSPWEVAAVFCFGREDVIPEMFQRLLSPHAESRLSSGQFEYYLQRHIELDGNEHGPLSKRMVTTLIGDSRERSAEALLAAQGAIEHRIHLWDGVLDAIRSAQSSPA